MFNNSVGTKDNKISLFVNKQEFAGWKSATMTNSINSICRSFTFTISQGEYFKKILPGDKCTVFIDAMLWLTGVIDSVDISIDNSNHNVSISGRSFARNVIDSSIYGLSNKGLFKNVQSTKIIQDILKTYNINSRIEIQDSPKTVKKFEIQDGEKGISAIQRICEKYNYILSSTSGEYVEIIQTSKDRKVLKQKYKKASARIDITNRQNKYIIRTRKDGRNEKDPKKCCSVTSFVIDSKIKDTNRVLIIKAEEPTDTSGAKDRAKRAMQTQIGASKTLNFTFAGLLKDDGTIWGCNTVYRVVDDILGVNQDFIITNISMSQSVSSNETVITMSPLEMYLMKAGKETVNKSSKIWSV